MSPRQYDYVNQCGHRCLRQIVYFINTAAEPIIQLENLTLLASVAQLQKLLRALYCSQNDPLLLTPSPIIEALHKFTLTYPNLTLLTLHSDQIITARSGQVITTPLIGTDAAFCHIFY